MAKFSLVIILMLAVVCGLGAKLRRCGIKCDTDYEAIVCGYNGQEYRIFQNECFMMNENCGSEFIWRQKPTDLCQERSKITKRQADCPLHCEPILNPVCATDGNWNYRQFANKCRFKKFNCNQIRKWKLTGEPLCRH